MFLLPVASQPRYWKRIHALRRYRVTARVFAFERPYVPLAGNDSVDVQSLGALEHGHYLQRLLPLARALGRIYREARTVDVVYCFGIDLAGLACIVSMVCPHLRVVLEVGDIRPVMIERGRKGRVFRALERVILRRVSLLVVTSAQYRDEYFVAQQRFPANRTTVIENKVDRSLLDPDSPAGRRMRTPGDPVVIGYIGLIRCRRSWTLLERLSSAAPDRFQVVVWGRVALEEEVPLRQLPAAMSYRGEYRNPNDLQAVYAEVDIVWGAHAHAVTHTRWARTNRFYEACCFARPLIGQLGTADGDEIEKHGLGMCVDLMDPDSALQQVLAISDDDLALWTRTSRELDPKVYTYTDEHEELMRRLRFS